MIAIVRQLFRSKPEIPSAQVPEGERVYAIGDIHGRLDLFCALIEAIEKDDRQRGSANTTIILLGDLIDRGPESSGVIEAARCWSRLRKVRFICGNHEEMFLISFFDLNALDGFLRYGGRETVLSYGVDPDALVAASTEEAQQMMNDAVPMADRDFIESFENTISIGDYMFVHAGIRPGAPLKRQLEEDCRWIREPFLSHQDYHGQMIVHGHSISEEVELKHNRIGIDTGAFMSGRLTAIGLEGEQRWLIQTRESEAGIDTFVHAA